MKPDVISDLVRIQKRAINRGTRYWIAAAERFTAGDLSLDSWVKAHTDWVEESFHDLDDALTLVARLRNQPGGGSK